MAARLETNSFQSKSRQAHPSHWLNRATCCMGIVYVIFIVLLYTVCFFDDNWMPCDFFLVWNNFPKDFLPMTFRGRPRPQRQGWSPEVLGANGWTGTRSRRVLGSSGRRGPGFLGIYYGFTGGARGLPVDTPVFTRWVDMGCLLRLSVKMLLDGLRDRRNHEKSWVQRKGQQMTLKSGRLWDHRWTWHSHSKSVLKRTIYTQSYIVYVYI